MTEIIKSISDHNNAQFDKGYKKGFAEGSKNNGSGFVSLVVILVIGYGLHIFAQKNIAAAPQTSNKVLGIQSSSENEVKPIPTNEINIVSDKSIDVKINTQKIDSNISLDISSSAAVRRGIFQPKK